MTERLADGTPIPKQGDRVVISNIATVVSGLARGPIEPEEDEQ